MTIDNPIDEIIAQGETPDYPTYDKKTIIESNYFARHLAEVDKAKEKARREHPEERVKDAANAQAEAEIVKDLNKHGFPKLQSLDEIKDKPKLYEAATPILIKYAKTRTEVGQLWRLSDLLKSIRSKKYSDDILDLIAILVGRDDHTGLATPIMWLGDIIKNTVGDKTSKIEELYGKVDRPDMKRVLGDLLKVSQRNK